MRASDDFRRVRSTGNSWAGRYLVMFAAPGPDRTGPTRIGITAARGVGGAVVRNAARRRVSEAARLCHARLVSGWDIVFVVRAAAADCTGRELRDEVESLLAASSLEVAAPCAD